jgi:hypothetical protein
VDKKSFDLQFQQKLKELKLKQPDTDEEEIRDDLIFLMLSRNASKFMELVTSSKNDDLSRGELSQLGGRYPSTVSLYATENFAELVAEKSSASRMGHPAGNPNNPAWRKLEAFVRGGVTQEVATAGMTRQQRRQLERANQNKKELDKNNYFDGIDINDLTESDNTNNMVILSTCTGFPHSLKERQEKSLKVLGAPIGAKPSDELVDGDGDGYVASTPGGVDDTRVSPKQEKRPKGEITKGNIDLNNRPVVKNRDGSISTVRSITITEGNTAVVIPTVIKKPNGSGVIVGDREAIKYYQRSGQHLGKFSNIRDADTYAQNLHNQQAVQYPNPGKSFIGGGVLSFKGVPKPKRKPPTVTSADINSLAIRLRQHNAKSKPEQRTNLRDIKIVFLRGLEDGSHDEAKKRVIKFLSLMGSDKPKDTKYSEDNDLLPLDHPWRNRKTKKKQVEFSEPEYGVKYGDGCCPKLVKRYHSL